MKHGKRQHFSMEKTCEVLLKTVFLESPCKSQRAEKTPHAFQVRSPASSGNVSPQPPVAQLVASSTGLDCLKEPREAWGEATHTLKHRYMQKEAAIGDLNAPYDKCVTPPSQEHLCSDVPCVHTCC